MSPSVVYVGMDVSKAKLDVHALGENRTVVNAAKGYRQLVKWLEDKGSVQVVCEATGGYEAAAVKQLRKAGVKVSVIAPLKVHYFAKSGGPIAKTDARDAQLLSEYGREKKPLATLELEPHSQELKELMTRREQLKEMVTQENNRRQQTENKEAKGQIKAHLVYLGKQLKQLQDKLKELVKAHASLEARVKQLSEVKGVGKITAMALLAFVPELGRVNRKRIAALVGVAPYNNDSGTFRGQRRIQGGRPHARKAMYMAALVAAFRNPHLSQFYQRLISAGKLKKVALVAVMRKLIVFLNSILSKPTEQLS